MKCRISANGSDDSDVASCIYFHVISWDNMTPDETKMCKPD